MVDRQKNLIKNLLKIKIIINYSKFYFSTNKNIVLTTVKQNLNQTTRYIDTTTMTIIIIIIKQSY